MISVRPSATHPSVRPSVRPSAAHPSVRPPLIRPSVSAFYPNPASDMKIRALCRIPGSNDSRKRHEMRLISKLVTVHPLGINERFSYIKCSPNCLCLTHSYVDRLSFLCFYPILSSVFVSSLRIILCNATYIFCLHCVLFKSICLAFIL